MNVVLTIELHTLCTEVAAEADHVSNWMNFNLAFLKFDCCLSFLEEVFQGLWLASLAADTCLTSRRCLSCGVLTILLEDRLRWSTADLLNLLHLLYILDFFDFLVHFSLFWLYLHLYMLL